MKITYLEHSGFTIEHEDVVMIFDYYKGRLPDMPAEKKVYVIGKIEGEKIDVAFLPLDLRQEEQFFWGMDYFMRHTDTRHVFPMHMWGRYEAYERLMERPESEGYRQKVMHITRTQQVFELEERKE